MWMLLVTVNSDICGMFLIPLLPMENIHKKADHNVPDNYRKVTVMPCIGKLFESVLNNRLSFKKDVCNDNDPFQAGFKSNSRTTDNIFILCAIIDKQRCPSKPLYTCFVDLHVF